MANGPTANGSNSKLLWWLISILSGSLIGIASHNVTSSHEHAQKIAVLEAQTSNTDQRLQRIEQKLDRILEHEKHHPPER